MKLSFILKRIYFFAVLVFLYAPIFVLVLFSFNKSKSNLKWTGFTFKWYIELFKDQDILKALYNTLSIALLTAIISGIFGAISAVCISRMNKSMKKIILSITNLPLVNPDIITGVSLMVLYIFSFKIFKFGRLGYMTLLLSHITFGVPYVIFSVLPKLDYSKKNIYEAALDLGASPSYAFIKVILPDITPEIITGMLFAFTLSIDDFIISFFTTGSGVNNLSILIYSMIRRGINPKINALSTLMFLFAIILFYFINKHGGIVFKSSDYKSR